MKPHFLFVIQIDFEHFNLIRLYQNNLAEFNLKQTMYKIRLKDSKSGLLDWV